VTEFKAAHLYSSNAKMPVMTRRGLLYCEVSEDGHVLLPDWVESADASHGPDLTVSDMEQIVSRLLKEAMETGENKPKPGSNPHEIQYIITGTAADRKLMCNGGVDSRPSAEVLAKAIRERDEARENVVAERNASNKYLAELAKERIECNKAKQERDEARRKATAEREASFRTVVELTDAQKKIVELQKDLERTRTEYDRRIKALYAELVTLRQRLSNVRKAACGKATEAAGDPPL